MVSCSACLYRYGFCLWYRKYYYILLLWYCLNTSIPCELISLLNMALLNFKGSCHFILIEMIIDWLTGITLSYHMTASYHYCFRFRVSIVNVLLDTTILHGVLSDSDSDLAQMQTILLLLLFFHCFHRLCGKGRHPTYRDLKTSPASRKTAHMSRIVPGEPV